MGKRVKPKTIKAKFVEPMLLLRTDALPDDPERWQYELKVDLIGAHSKCRIAAATQAGKPDCQLNDLCLVDAFASHTIERG